MSGTLAAFITRTSTRAPRRGDAIAARSAEGQSHRVRTPRRPHSPSPDAPRLHLGPGNH